MSWTVMLIMAIQLLILNTVRYTVLPVLYAMLYALVVVAMLPIAAAWGLWLVSDNLADWVEHRGGTRPNSIPNLPW